MVAGQGTGTGRWLAVTGVAGVVVAVGVTAGNAQDSAESIQLCVKDNGSVRIVNLGSPCDDKESPLVINSPGPAGEPGEQGEPGQKGDPGQSAFALAQEYGFGGTAEEYVTEFLRGPAGGPGPQGEPGPRGDPGVGFDDALFYRVETIIDEPTKDFVNGFAKCTDPEDIVLNGGFSNFDPQDAVTSFSADYQSNPDAWAVGARDRDGDGVEFNVFATCVKVS